MTPEQGLILERMLQDDLYLSPYKFAMWAYDWGEGDLRQFKGPRKWQREIMEDIEKYLRDALAMQRDLGVLPDFYRHAIASGRGPGKSALVGMLAHWFISTRIGGSVWVAANGEPQLRTKTFPEISKWVSRGINREFFELNATSIQPKKWFGDYIESPKGLGKSTRYYYANGQLWSEENPDSFAGAHNFDGEFAIFDEASGIPSVIWTVQEGVFTENTPDRFWLAFSNPRKNSGAFFECFHKNREMWRTTKVDSRTVEGISVSTYDNIIAQFGEDSNEAKVEVYGEFPSSDDDQFIGPGIVNAAVQRELHKDSSAPIVVGVDPARGGSDATVIAIRQGRDLLELRKYHGEDTMQTVGRVIDTIKEWSPSLTVIDEGGLGYGILDRLVEQGYNVRGVNFGSKAKNPVEHGNKRAEIWSAMREWLKTASIPDDRQLKDDLTGPLKKPTSSGAIMLEGKKEMRARGMPSPDNSDALAVTFSYPLGGGILKEDQFRLWVADRELPVFEYVVQSYYTPYDSKTLNEPAACTVWGTFVDKGDRGVMLLDAWSERIGYEQLRDKIVKEYHSVYGVKNGQRKGRKVDTVLIEGRGSGISLFNDLRQAFIPVIPYNPGNADPVNRVHQVSPILDTDCVYIPESVKNAGSYTTWAVPFVEQMERFPNDTACEYVDTFTQAMIMLRDKGHFELGFAEEDEIENTKDYGKDKKLRENPYAM